MVRHRVKQGESIASIANRTGHLPETLWKDAGNATLRQSRTSPNILKPGDLLEIPDKEPKSITCGSGSRHGFRRKQTTMKIRVRMLDEFNEPRSNLQFDVRIDDVLQACSSDGNGLVEVEVPAVTKTVELLLEDENIPLEVGAIDPLEEPSGVQARLNNLGYFCGAIDGVVDTLTENAIREFQREHDLEVTGAADDQTLAALRDQFGC